VSARKMHEIWIEQCDACQAIRLRYGLKAAFDYVVAEKLLKFADAAARHPQFARELPRFISRVRRMFTPDDIRTHIARVEWEQRNRDADIEEDDELLRDSPAAAAERARQLTTIKELLTAAELGTS
jgi:hypothetical protein